MPSARTSWLTSSCHGGGLRTQTQIEKNYSLEDDNDLGQHDLVLAVVRVMVFPGLQV
jgi:hypothetical protein